MLLRPIQQCRRTASFPRIVQKCRCADYCRRHGPADPHRDGWVFGKRLSASLLPILNIVIDEYGITHSSELLLCLQGVKKLEVSTSPLGGDGVVHTQREPDYYSFNAAYPDWGQPEIRQVLKGSPFCGRAKAAPLSVNSAHSPRRPSNRATARGRAFGTS